MTAIDDATGNETLEVEEPTFEDLAARVDQLRDRVRHSEEQALLEETLEAITEFNRAGLVELVLRAAERRLPTLGICLGHQAIGLAFGARLVRSTPAHGKLARVTLDASRCLDMAPTTLTAMRYHSLSLVDVRPPLTVVGTLADGTVMAVEHQALPLLGLQFHPDSHGTPRGRELVGAFFRAAGLP